MSHRGPALALVAALWLASCASTATPTTTSLPAAGSTATPTTGGGTMQLTSTAFEDGTAIPARYTCDGADVSPPLAIAGIPDETAALVLVMDDPDAPGRTWDHWVEFDIPVTAVIAEDAGVLGTTGRNSWGRAGYGGPCPPSGTHRYFFRVIAVSELLELPEGATKAEVLEAAGPLSLGEATLLGRYSRS